MPADPELAALKASRVAEAADLLRAGWRPDRVRKHMREKYDQNAHTTVWYWVDAALKEVAPELARSLNNLRLSVSLDVQATTRRIQTTISKALSGERPDLMAAMVGFRSLVTAQQLYARLWHLDKISPLMGLEARETRAQLVEALRDSAHLLTEEQRQELRDALSEIGDEDESVTTTMEAR